MLSSLCIFVLTVLPAAANTKGSQWCDTRRSHTVLKESFEPAAVNFKLGGEGDSGER